MRRLRYVVKMSRHNDAAFISRSVMRSIKGRHARFATRFHVESYFDRRYVLKAQRSMTHEAFRIVVAFASVESLEDMSADIGHLELAERRGETLFYMSLLLRANTYASFKNLLILVV